MSKQVKKNESAMPQPVNLRRRAEEIAKATANLSPENIDGQSPEEIRQTLHELRVHQIELDMQNEELLRTQVELDTARARYFDLYDLAPVGYCTLSEKGLILEANLTCATLLNVSRGGLVKQPISRFILKEDQDIYYRHRKQLFETGEPQSCELRLVKKDATQFWAHLESTFVQDNDDGAPVCRIVISDISELKQVEESIQRAKEMLELANSELEKTLAREQQLARADGLTGLYNRRYFFELAVREFSAALRYQRPLAIIMFDTDNLKQVNDNFGHLVGDRLLVMVAQTSALQLRTVDELARYGGDEFIVLLPQTSAQQALPIAERIREQIAAIHMETDKGPAGITLSIGIAETQHEPVDQSVEAVMSRADKALYAAKAEGRNCTVIYGEEKQLKAALVTVMS